MLPSKDLLASIFLNNPTPTAIIDSSGNFNRVNKSFCNLVGYSDHELINRPIALILPILEQNNSQQHSLEGLSNASGDRYEILRKNQERLHVAIHIERIKECETYVNVIYIDAIASQREDYEETLNQLNKDLIRKAEELESSNKELEKFAYVASHDLQEPLRMITSFLELLKKNYESSLDEVANKYIFYSIQGAERMKLLINDLLKYSRVGTISLEKVPVDMNEIFNDVLFLLHDEVLRTHAEIKAHHLPVVVAGKTAMSQLLQNLISNALRYQLPNNKPVITINAETKENEFLFIVTDNGIGIDAKFYERIFIVFQRLHNRNEYSGTGIGLAICKKIIDRYGGKIWVESVTGEGSKFMFTLPRQTI